MNNIRKHKYLLPAFILTRNYYVDNITCKKLKRLQFNINLINRIKKDVSRDKKFFSVDTESYEYEHNKLTEFGWSIFNNDGTIIKEQHFIVDEYYDLRNHDFVPDNKDNYLFGVSERKTLYEIRNILQEEISTIDFIVGQSIHTDIKYLKNIGIDFTGFTFVDGENFNVNGKAIIETSDLYTAFFLYPPSSLEKGLQMFDITYKNLHNAGNY